LSTATFTPNGRTVTFNGGGTQDINGVSGSIAFAGFALNKASGQVELLTDASINPGAAAALEFNGSAGDIINLNGKTFTINSGTIGGSNSAGAFKGSGFSSLVLNGTGALGTLQFTSGDESLSSLTMNRTSSGSVTLGSALSINSTLTLTSGIINTGAFTLTMETPATSNGSSASYVNGTMKKNYFGGLQNFTFDLGTVGGTTPGYTPVAVDNQASSPAGDVTASVTNATHGAFNDPTVALRRFWSLTNNGLTLANLTFTYLDGDVPGTTNDALFVPFKFDGTTSMPPGTVNAGLNTISVPGVTSFSDWSAAEPTAPTAVRLSKFKAIGFNDGVQVNWESGYEVNNLGYHVYRELNGVRTRVTPAVVAGSALKVSGNGRMASGFSYSWFDPQGTAGAVYYLEAIDLNGQRETVGPIFPYNVGGVSPVAVRKRAMLLNEVADSSPTNVSLSNGAANTTANLTDRPATMTAVAAKGTTNVSLSNIDAQRAIAAGRAVKISVRRSGWYRVTQAQLLAAGLDPNSDARRLQLFVDGEELPMLVNGDQARLVKNDSIEFYGQALDTLNTDTHVYWLVNGATPGKRLNGRWTKFKPGGANWADGSSPNSGFAMTTERKDKLVYFSGLLNGDGGNIFGPPVTSDPLTQVLTVRNLDREGPAAAQVSVKLQGLTAGEHVVAVQLNGSSLGTISFNGLGHPAQTFPVNRALLREGDNTVILTSTNGEADVSLVDSVALTYGHAYRADNDSLRFSAPAGQPIVVGGFSSPEIRVIDVTNPNSPNELGPQVGPQGSGYAFKLQPTGVGTRTIVAFTDVLAEQASQVTANQPSTWSTTRSADMLIVTHRDFRAAVEPLAAQRRSEGLQVAVVDIEDVYDEFSFGAHTPNALRDFIGWAGSHWQRAPQYLLLAGDSSWDPRNYLEQGNGDLVPTKLIDTGYMETASDDWLADFNGDGAADIAVGRLPGRTPAEIGRMVSKILSYEQERQLGTPARGALMVADTGFEGKSGATAGLLPAGIAVQTINRSEVGSDDVMRGQIVNGIDSGPLLVNYFGHGSVTVWTGAGLLDSDLALGLTNSNKPSLFVLMTCLNGYSHDAYIDSLAESLLKADGGAMAVWASSGFTEAEPQFAMNQQFYQQLFSGAPGRLGDATRAAKAATTDSDVRRTWILLGDPSMRMR
jgi:hypothetical protein